MTQLDHVRALAVRQAELIAELNQLAGSFAEDELGEEMLATFAAAAARRAADDLAALARRLGGEPLAVFPAKLTVHTA